MVRWIDTSCMVADCLAKRMRSGRLSGCLRSCWLDLIPTDESVLCKNEETKGKGRILMVVLVTWTETTILINCVPALRSSLRNEVFSIRHADDESYGCENHRVLQRYRHSMSLFNVMPQGPLESNCRKQLSLSSCGWVLIRSGQFKITETLSHEVGLGAIGESSIEDITGSLTEAARAVNFDRRGVCGQLGPKDSRSEFRGMERPNRKWSTSQRERRMGTCTSGDRKQGHCNTWLTRGNVQGKRRQLQTRGKGQSESTRSLSLGRRSPRRSSEDGRGVSEGKIPKRTSPSGHKEQPPCKKYLKETCTGPSCDCWHPPDGVKHYTKEGCDFGDKCAFFR